MDITFITGNPNKANYVAQWLHHPINHHALDLPEIQSLDVRDVVAAKAESAYQALGTPVLVEDVSMQFTALGRLPGPFVKWFEKELGLEAVCRLLDAYDDRSATVVCCYGLYDGHDMRFFEGIMHGTIADHPRGDNGFGFDAVFINDGQSLTRGEMDEKTYEETSMRKAALIKLAEFLQSK